jgi:hypothetical protein
MTEKINTQSNPQEVGTQYVFNAEPDAPSMVLEGISRAVDHVKLEARMVVFDAFHGTHYRKVRHELMAIKKREQFEQSIGLVAISN